METIAKGGVFDESKTDVGSIISTVKELHGFDVSEINQDHIDSISLVTVPAGMSLHDITSKLDARRAGPRRIKATEQTHTLDSFIDVVNRHRGDGTSIWADSNGPTMTAIIDYHKRSDGESGPEPAWCEHRVQYKFPFTDAFTRWSRAGLLSQRDFLAFCQERAREIVDPEDIGMPDPGTLARDVMLEVLRASGMPRSQREQVEPREFYGTAAHLVDVAKRMSSKVGSSVKEVDRGLGGVTVTFEDEKRVEGTENAREYYLVEVAPFKGSTPSVLPARLRAEATDSGLKIGLQLVGIDRVIEKAFIEALQLVHQATGCPVYQGTPG